MRDDRPNIVLVTVDSLRADHCGFMGYEKDTTPTLNRLAELGTVFENAIAPGFGTFESMPTIFTESSAYDFYPDMSRRKQAVREHMLMMRSLPERFAERGYTTLGFTANPFTSRLFGFDQGFDYFEDFLTSDTMSPLYRRILSRWIDGRFVGGGRFLLNMVGLGDTSIAWEDHFEEQIQAVERFEEPFFLWVFLLEPHWPYQPPRRYREDISLARMYHQNWASSPMSRAVPDDPSDLLSLYDGTIRHVDEYVNCITNALEPYDPTVVLHADHGEAFGDHGTYGHGELYEETVHVPLLISNTGRAERIEAPISLRLLPSILTDLADGAQGTLDTYTQQWVVAQTSGSFTVRGHDWKLIVNSDGAKFYHLEDDPREQSPVQGNDALRSLGERAVYREQRDSLERRSISHVVRKVVKGGRL